MSKIKKTPELLARAKQLIDQGWTQAEIADEIGVGRPTIGAWLETPEQAARREATAKQYREANREAQKEYDRKYYAANREARLESSRKWHAALAG
ncbi:helix-turn-helix domain-containing protein [Synechococcus sp. UW179A]|uniref:terminase gpP N-terminus-related DNA-binding protein n=1 Tax=Synechococcus sp. UW179A TaxID=2575510 RepID=UPI000E0EDAEF|nr:helix-turn-helix domain-containing protein [Synechococcus sp. UW179A]